MQRVIERILNLLAFLLTVGRPVTADEIRQTVQGYEQDSDEAFRRTFERDKDLIKSLGVPLRLDFTDKWEVEQGYVVSPDEYALPDPGLTDEERIALALAMRMVRLGGHGSPGGALLKLGGAATMDTGDPFTADLGDGGDGLADVFTAVVDRRILTFGYHDKPRRVKPLGLVHRIGHWYLIADAGDDGTRAFRVDRMLEPQAGDRAGAFERPPGFRAADALPGAPWEAGSDDLVATVVFDASVAWWAQRQLTARAGVVDNPGGGITATIPVSNPAAFIGWLIGFEGAAQILEPPDLVDNFISHIRQGQ